MTTKHTPGPWKAVGRDVLSMHASPRSSGPLVCVVDDNDDDRWPADSALIAAAPDLLAACERLLDAVERGDHKAKAVDAARAAIARAKGGAA